MAALDLLRLFESLVMPMGATSGNDLSAVPIPGADTHRLAKDTNGSPCLLIRQPPRGARSAPIRLENLVVSFDVPCRIREPDGKQGQGTFTIVRCSGANPGLFSHFLRIISPMITALGPSPTPAVVRRSISALVELFQALAVPGKKTIQGIWAELLLIRLSRDLRAMTVAWHRDPVERFDFAAGPQRLEVKSSNSRRREHYFSLDQLTPSGNSLIVVASVFVERSGGGMSLRKLFDDTRALIADDASLASHFDAVFYKALGSGWADAMDECFDWELAVDSIAFYAAEGVPRPDNPVPQSVFDVRFRSELGSAALLAFEQLQAHGGLFAAAAPTRS